MKLPRRQFLHLAAGAAAGEQPPIAVGAVINLSSSIDHANLLHAPTQWVPPPPEHLRAASQRPGNR
jgi:hypothetical protein